MRILITAGPTREAIDPVRYLSNRSTGTMGAALVTAANGAGHDVTLICGPVTVAMPAVGRRIDLESSVEMFDAVLDHFPHHDLLIMAAAVADYRPKNAANAKLERGGSLTIELVATEDILAAAGKTKTADQRTVGFSLVDPKDVARSVEKIRRKNLDLIVSNPLSTMGSTSIEAVLLWPDGRAEAGSYRTKAQFADVLIRRAKDLFG